MISITLVFLGFEQFARGQEKTAESASKENPVEKPEITDRFKQNPEYVDEEKQPLSDAEKKSICKKFNNRHISYYGNVYFVEDCYRREVSVDDIYELTRKKVEIVEVDSRTIEALNENSLESKPSKHSDCKAYERSYITFSFVDVYWVENCRKRVFPDWATYENHRGSISKSKTPIVALSWEEFSTIPTGQPFSSIIDQEFRELLSGDAGAEVIPLDEACHNIIGKYVTYLGGIYYIERVAKGVQGSDGSHCRKKRVDAAKFTKKYAHSKVRLQELSSSQALSIPDGIPLEDDQY